MRGIRHVLVVVPARDEEALVGGCLDALAAAVAALGAGPLACPVTVVVVLDGCSDTTARQVARRPWASAVHVELGVVGAVRAAGVQAGLARLPDATAADAVWVACTDADSRVPPTWLSSRLVLAAQGVDLVVGSVEPDPADLGPEVLRGWHAGHPRREDHGTVHGANLGMRLSAYLAVGGFRDLPVHEDVDLVRRLRLSGAVWRSTDEARVVTSGRRRGRVCGGFADFLAALETDTVDVAG